MQVNVTQENFLEVLPKIEEAIFDSDFIAFDFEFLGLDEAGISLFDSPAQRYEILRRSVTKYAPCQLGLSLYSQTSDETYEADVYTIPLFQQLGGPRNFSIHKDALNFLRFNNFDFQNVFKNGVQYCTRKQLDNYSFDFSEFESLDCEIIENSAYSTSFEIDFPEKLNHLEKLLITSKLSRKYPDLSFLIQGDVLLAEERKKREEDIFETSILGVTKIIETIVDSKTLIVGHNCFADLMYIFQYFFDDLPESYELYKSILHSKLPYIFDTKHFAKTSKISNILSDNGILDNNFECLSNFFQSPASHQLTPHTLRNNSEISGNFHDAGFDSYQCGQLFIKLSHILIGDTENIIDFPRMFEMIKDVAMNRIPMSLTDVEYCDLTKREDKRGNRPDIIQIRKRSGEKISEAEKLEVASKLNWQLKNYRTSLRIGKSGKVLEIATNTPTTYAFVCDKYSKNPNWILCDELDGNSLTYEQRLTSATKMKEAYANLRNIDFQIARIENILTNKAAWRK